MSNISDCGKYMFHFLQPTSSLPGATRPHRYQLPCLCPTYHPPPATPPAGGPGSSFLGNPHQPSSSLSWQGSQLTLWPFSNGIQKPGSTSHESQSVKKHLRFSRPSDFLLDTCKLPFLGFFLNCFNICFYENIQVLYYCGKQIYGLTKTW